MNFYKLICDIMHCYLSSCAITLLIFFFDTQALFAKEFSQENARTMVGSVFISILLLFAIYVLLCDRTRYKKSMAHICSASSMGTAVFEQTNSEAADYNKTVNSFHEAGHVVMSHLKKLEKYDAFVTDTNPHVVSVYKHWDAAGIRDYILMLYAGAAAEELFLGAFHSGVAYGDDSDFKRATDCIKIYLMMTHSDVSKACLDDETAPYIKELSNNLYNEALEILSQNKNMVGTIANELKQKGSLMTKEIKKLLETKIS